MDGTGAGAAGAGRAEVRGGVVEQDPTPDAAAALDGRAAEGQVAQPGSRRRTQRIGKVKVNISYLAMHTYKFSSHNDNTSYCFRLPADSI